MSQVELFQMAAQSSRKKPLKGNVESNGMK